MNVDAGLFLWGMLVTIIFVGGIVTGEWTDMLHAAVPKNRFMVLSRGTRRPAWTGQAPHAAPGHDSACPSN